MKKTISILLALFLFAALACYAPHGEESTVVVNDLPGVYCEIVEGTLTPIGAEVRFWNTLDREDLWTGPMHFLEIRYFGKWYNMDYHRKNPSIDGPWDTVAYPIFSDSSGREYTHFYSWNAYYPLEPGHYRIVFPYHEGSGKTIKHHLLAAEFTIR